MRPLSGRRVERTTQSRRWLLVFICLSVVLAGVKTCSVISGRTNPVDHAINRAAAPLVAVVRYLGQGIASFGHVFRLPTIMQEQRRLSSEVRQLRRELAESESLDAENHRLRQLLKTNAPEGYREVHASVAARPYELWIETVMINKGRKDGINEGNLVINEDGVVGTVREVQPSYCWVELVVSPRFRLAGYTSKTLGEGVVRGIDSATLELMYIAAGNKAQVGERVLTSGVAGTAGEVARRPRGVLIGTINGRQADQNGFLDITINPAVNPNRITDVTVLVR